VWKERGLWWGGGEPDTTRSLKSDATTIREQSGGSKRGGKNAPVREGFNRIQKASSKIERLPFRRHARPCAGMAEKKPIWVLLKKLEKPCCISRQALRSAAKKEECPPSVDRSAPKGILHRRGVPQKILISSHCTGSGWPCRVFSVSSTLCVARCSRKLECNRGCGACASSRPKG